MAAITPANDPPILSLSEDTIDDLVYLARAGELDELKTEITTLTTTQSCPASTILLSAIDLASGNTLLHYPAANGSLPITTYLLSILPPSPTGLPAAVSKQILDRKNNSGNTALHWAALNGHLEVVKALVEAGADPGVMNAAGRDAIVEAEMSGKEGADKCAVWMLEHWAGAEQGIGAGEEGADANGEVAEVNGMEEKAA
jgi:uncharacterized protein